MPRKKNPEKFFEQAHARHEHNYGYDNFVYVNTDTKGMITCPIHGDFPQTPANHLKGAGCPKCADINRAASRKKTLETFIEQGYARHNGKYSYGNSVYLGNHVNVLITCPIHGDFPQTPANHLNGAGCPKCADCQLALLKRKDKEVFIEQGHAKHNGKYSYCNSVYLGNHVNVLITCPIHGDFPQTPANHLNGAGCKKCVGRLVSNREEFIEQAHARHGHKYGYDNFVYDHSHAKCIITCPFHGDFPQTQSDHLRGAGCPRCKESRGERAIRLYLERTQRLFRQEHRVRGVGRFDFAVKRDRACFIEYHGQQHYFSIAFGSKRPSDLMLEDCMRRDHKKEQRCKDRGFPLLVIPYWDKARITQILDDFFAGKTPVISEPPEIVKKYEPIRQKILERITQLEPD